MRAFRIAYDGHAYHGFQRQPDVPTVSDAILDALRALDVLAADAVPPGYAAAGRTDAGASATAQTVAFEGPDWLDPGALNAELPADVCAWASAAVPDDFHATHDATERAYTYYLHRPATGEGRTRGGGEADAASAGGSATDEPLGRARSALDRLAGEHDFHNLTPDSSGTVRRLETAVERQGPVLVLRFRADGFPRQLVRRVASLVDEVARGEAGLDRVERVLGDAAMSGPAGVGPMPAYPLVLTGVTYPGVGFDRDPAGLERVRSVFAERRREHELRGRVNARLSAP